MKQTTKTKSCPYCGADMNQNNKPYKPTKEDYISLLVGAVVFLELLLVLYYFKS